MPVAPVSAPRWVGMGLREAASVVTRSNAYDSARGSHRRGDHPQRAAPLRGPATDPIGATLVILRAAEEFAARTEGK